MTDDLPDKPAAPNRSPHGEAGPEGSRAGASRRTVPVTAGQDMYGPVTSRPRGSGQRSFRGPAPCRPAPRAGIPWGKIALAAAAALAGTALYVERQTRQAEQAHPPAGRFVTVDGVRLHYLERGPERGRAPERDLATAVMPRLPREAPAIVLLHGNSAMIEDFVLSGLIDRLAAAHRVIAFDRPGYGHSTRPGDRRWTPMAQAELFVRAFAQLGMERPVVLGHSWGALVALSLALDHPAAVSGLVLIGGYYYPTRRLDVGFVAPAAWPVIGGLLRHTVTPLMGRAGAAALIAKLFAPRPVPPYFVRQFPLAMSLRPSQIQAAAEEAVMMARAAAGMQRRYHELALPIAIMAGADDRMVEAMRHSMRLRREVRHAELYLLPGHGHMLHHTAAGRVEEAVRRVAARTAAGTRAFRPPVRPVAKPEPS